MITTISDTEWAKKYKPIKNHLDDNASCNGEMFETYGEELEFIRQQDPSKVWTYADDAEGNTYVASGYSLVNRIGYFITEVGVSQNDLVIVEWGE